MYVTIILRRFKKRCKQHFRISTQYADPVASTEMGKAFFNCNGSSAFVPFMMIGLINIIISNAEP
jgi:hypothetical protein